MKKYLSGVHCDVQARRSCRREEGSSAVPAIVKSPQNSIRFSYTIVKDQFSSHWISLGFFEFGYNFRNSSSVHCEKLKGMF